MEARLEVYKKILAVIYIFLIGLFALLCLQNGEDSGDLSFEFSGFFADLFSLSNTEEFTRYIRKLIGHFGFFCFFGLISSLLYLSITKFKIWIRILISLISGFVYILITEFGFQMVAVNRGPSINDVLLDYSGFIIVSFLVYFLFFIFVFIEKKKINKDEKLRKIFMISIIIIYALLLISNIALSVINAAESSKVSASVSQVVIDTVPGTGNKTVSSSDNTTKLFLRKLIGHFGYFALIGFFSYFLYTNIRKIKNYYRHGINMITGLGFAFISEYICQALVKSRNSSIKDVIINSSGFIMITIILSFLMYSIKLIIEEDDNLYFK